MLYSGDPFMNLTVISNFSSPPICEPNEAAKIAARVQKIILPVICALGFIGNILSATVFLSKSQRKTSCSLYLAARSIADMLFLVTVLIVNVTDLGINLFNHHGVCQIVIFLTYVCGFLSVWFVVMVTVENYIRICHPFQVTAFCTTKIAKIVIFCFVIIAFTLYNFPLWTTSLAAGKSGVYQCLPRRQYAAIRQILVYGDTVVTLLIPTMMIIFLMVAITYGILQMLHRRSRLKGKRQNGEHRHSSPQSKVTKLLFAVSAIFILLTLPSHIIRVQLTVKYLYNTQDECPTIVELAPQHVFNVLYYVSFAVNILIYLSFGEKFRSVFCNIFIKKLLRSENGNNAENMPLNNAAGGETRNRCLKDITNNGLSKL